MKLYPDVPRRRARTIAADAALLLAIALFAWIGTTVHDAVEELTAVSEGVQEVGGTVQGAFTQAGDAVGSAPIIGGQIGDALRGAGQSTGGRAAEAGRDGQESITELADLLGWLFFGVPVALVLSRFLPPRVEQVRKLTAARAALDAGASPERRALMAQRAAFGLPYATLLRHTDDPLGDLAAGRLEPLVAALREDAGLSRDASARRRARAAS